MFAAQITSPIVERRLRTSSVIRWLAVASLLVTAADDAIAQLPVTGPVLQPAQVPAIGAEVIPPGVMPNYAPQPLPPPEPELTKHWDAIDIALAEPDFPSEPPPDRILTSRRIGMSWISAGGPSGFGITEFDLHASVTPWRRDNGASLVITPGFAYHGWSAPPDLQLPSQVFDTYIDINWQRRITERWGLNLGVTPGVYGDYNSFHSDAFQVTGWALTNFTVGPKLSLLGGVAAVRQTESHVLPVGGIVWTPREDWRFELIFPRPRIARRFVSSTSRTAWAYVAGQFGGGSWSIIMDDSTSTLVTYSDLRVLAGMEWYGSDRFSGVAEVGYVFARNLSAFGLTQLVPDSSVICHAGLTF